MRITSDLRTDAVWNVNYEWLPPFGAVNPPQQSFTGSGIRHVSGKSNVLKSDFSKPTHYRAYDIRVDPLNYHIQGHGSTYRKYVKVNGKWKYVYSALYADETGKRPFPNSALVYLGFDPDTFDVDISQILRDRCVNKVLKKIRNAEIEIGQNLAELRESVTMMSDRLKSVVRLYTLVRGRKWKQISREYGIRNRKQRASRTADSLASKWLEYKLGWQPLLSDIFGGCQAIQSILNREELFKVKAVEEGTPLGWIPAGYSWQGSRRQGCQIGITARIDDAGKARLSAMGLANPLSLAWELVPMSFVIDYFFSIGDFLDGLNAWQGLTFVHGYETQYLKATGTLQSDSFSRSYSVVPVYGTFPKWKVQAFGMKRSPLLFPPLPRLTLNKGLSTFGRSSIVAALAIVKTRKH
jgi:hypothetical protein